jgi:hypothetical protein
MDTGSGAAASATVLVMDYASPDSGGARVIDLGGSPYNLVVFHAPAVLALLSYGLVTLIMRRQYRTMMDS